MRLSRKLKLILAVFVVVIGSFAAYCVSLGNEPNFQVTLDRTIPSSLSVSYIDQVVGSLKTWPLWFHAGKTADEVDFRGFPYPKALQKVETRGILRLGMEANLGLPDPFVITLLVEEYTPGKRIRMRVLKDSKNKITRLFDDIEWEIDLLPNGSGSQLREICTAHTRTWRARVLSRLVPHVILNQIFYPNLFVLAQFNNPSVVHPDPETEHGGM